MKRVVLAVLVVLLILPVNLPEPVVGVLVEAGGMLAGVPTEWLSLWAAQVWEESNNRQFAESGPVIGRGPAGDARGVGITQIYLDVHPEVDRFLATYNTAYNAYAGAVIFARCCQGRHRAEDIAGCYMGKPVGHAHIAKVIRRWQSQ